MNGLEPVMSEKLLLDHYKNNHAFFIEETNEEWRNSTKYTIGNSFNLGAHLNHEFFWESLCPIYQGGGIPPITRSPLG